eukprot:CAMPEP_0181098962 /NCGR_PEP_ID=MMETSP1071-20121207/12408_1 /TAXON_ID=35127 /ORGANISM="Thalassiosira sp., Strain NH16" /LENGTH=133 /DNA_ID=CAMNT_0023181597 /DNA_START=457 /DNA_END=858 /DNA_ORIENTATION=+
MQWLSLLTVLPSVALAFQSAPTHHHRQSASALNYFPDNFNRAELCATQYDTCNIDEVERLEEELKQFLSSETGNLQDRDDYTDTRRVVEMLHAQSVLKHTSEDYAAEHQSTMDGASNAGWGNEGVSGLGLGLW